MVRYDAIKDRKFPRVEFLKIQQDLNITLLAKPGSGVIQEIVCEIVPYAVMAQVNKHHALDLSNDKQPLRVFLARKALVGRVALMEPVRLFVVVYYGHEFSLRYEFTVT
jgi:hypothetical protein